MRLSPALALVMTLAACGGDDGGPGPDAAPPTGPARVHVDRYRYELDLETRASSSTLDLHVIDGGDCVTLANRNPTLTAASVTLDGQPAQVTLTPTTITACAATGWYPGADVVLATHQQQNLSTLGASQVGYSVGQDSLGQPVWYLVSWVNGCDRFGPCDPTPSAFAHYSFTVHHREGVKALCPGRITAMPTVTTCEFDHAGGPTYSTFGLIANASWQETSLGDWGGVHASLWAKPDSRVAAALDRAYVSGFFAWMVQTFGAYPYGDELRVVVAPTYWSGFEHPGNIVLDEGLGGRPGVPPQSPYLHPISHVLAHELVHQWAGDQTTLADTYDFVWKESMAEYLSYVYESEHDEPAGTATAAYWKAASRGARYFPVPQEHPALFDYYGHVYGPGPMVLFRQLEAMTSRAKVLAALKTLLGREHAISVDDVQRALEASTGLDLDRYFDIWVRGTGAPAWASFMVQVTREPPSQHVMLTETTDGFLHPCDFSVLLRGANGESAKVRFVRGLDPASFMSIDTSVPWVVTSTVLDPDSECLAFPAAAARTELRPPGWSPWVTANQLRE